MQEEEERDQALQAKASLDIPLVPETEDDRRLAALLKFHTLDCAWGPGGEGGGVGGDGGCSGRGRLWTSSSPLPLPIPSI